MRAKVLYYFLSLGALTLAETCFAKPAGLTQFTVSDPAPNVILLQPTAVAQYQAAGSARFEGGTDHPENPGALVIEAQRLDPGYYLIGVAVEPNGERLALGPVTLLDPTAAPDRETHENTMQTSNAHQSTFLALTTRVQLPPGLSPEDISKIMVSDPFGNDVLVGTVAR
jgi:hypothetical protein